MRGDVGQADYRDRTKSEMVERETIAGFNMIKIVKYTNLIVGTALIAVVIMSAITLGVFAPISFALTFFQSVFGLIIIASSFGHKCVRRNFLFMMTGVGRGCFNIFVGTLLFFNSEHGKIFTVQNLMGFFMILAGGIFIFLSKYKQLSDDDIQRAVSVQKKSVANAVGNAAMRNQASIKRAAYNNQDVIAQVAYENKDVIAQAAYDNRELLAD